MVFTTAITTTRMVMLETTVLVLHDLVWKPRMEMKQNLRMLHANEKSKIKNVEDGDADRNRLNE